MNPVTINLPPLRERKDDIPLLAEHFSRIYCDMYGLRLKRVEPEVLKTLRGYPGPAMSGSSGT